MVTRIPADGPDMALFRMVRKLRLRYSQAFVVQAINSHPRPSSLLALVEVAGRMGVKTTPVKADASGLPKLTLPAVVHFTDPGGEGGFGVLEAVAGDRLQVWDSANGRRPMERDLFLSRWSGVVVMMQRADEPGAAEHRYLRQRFLEVVGGGTSTPAVADGRAAPFLRAALVLILAVLLSAAVAATPATDRAGGVALVVLVLLGLAVATLMAASTGDHDSALANRVCRRGKLVDCHSVLTSRYSRFFGLPLSDVGLAFYGSVLLLIASGGWLAPVGVWRVTTLAFTAAVPFAVLLVGIQISMRQLCTLCMVTHVVNLSSALIGWLLLRHDGVHPRDLLLGVLLALHFGIVLFFVIPYFRRSRSLVLVSERHRKSAASPFGTLAQILAEPPTDIAGPGCGVAVKETAGPHEVVLFVHPGCGKCLPVLRELLAVAQVAPLKVFVGVAPKDPVEADRHSSSILVAAWLAMNGDRIVDGYSAAKQHLGKLAAPGAERFLAEELSIDPTELETRMGEARPLVERAERAVDDHADGTPALFFDSRPFSAPLAHLAFLIQNHPELLRSK